MNTTAHGTTDPFADAIADLLRSNPKPFFVQVGGFDGVSFDPLRQHIVDQNLTGLIIEPVPQYFEKLQSLYAGSGTVTPVNCAIAEENGERTIWRFNPKAVEGGLLPPHFAGIVSFVMEDLLKDDGVLAASSPDEETRAVLRSQLRPVPVQCRTMDTLLGDHHVENVDILQIDTEGYDYNVLKLFDFVRFHPAIVHYEHQHLNTDDFKSAEALLRSHGYRLRRGTYDTLAVRGEPDASGRFKIGALRKLAVSLLAEGNAKAARLLLEHLEALQSDDEETLLQLVRALGAEGEPLKALHKLATLKSVVVDTKSMVAEIRVQMPPAVKLFNDYLAAGNIVEAEKYVAALAELIPGNGLVMNSALELNIALGRKDQAMRYAASMLVIDRNHAVAKALLTETRH